MKATKVCLVALLILTAALGLSDLCGNWSGKLVVNPKFSFRTRKEKEFVSFQVTTYNRYQASQFKLSKDGTFLETYHAEDGYPYRLEGRWKLTGGTLRLSYLRRNGKPEAWVDKYRARAVGKEYLQVKARSMTLMLLNRR